MHYRHSGGFFCVFVQVNWAESTQVKPSKNHALPLTPMISHVIPLYPKCARMCRLPPVCACSECHDGVLFLNSNRGQGLWIGAWDRVWQRPEGTRWKTR